MIRIERASLPDGLRVVAHREDNRDLLLVVSDALDAAGQRLAVRTALRASRRAGWRAAVPILVALPWAARLLLRRAAAVLRIRPAALACAAGVTGAAAIALIVSVTAQPHGSRVSLPPPTQEQIGGALPGVSSSPVPAPGRTAAGRPRPGQSGRPRPGQPATSQPHPGSSSPSSVPASPAPGRTRPVPSPSPTRSPEPSPTPTASPSPSPTLSPSPSPTSHQGKPGRKSCVVILGIRVCVPLRIVI